MVHYCSRVRRRLVTAFLTLAKFACFENVILSSTTFRAFKSVWKPILKQIFAAVIFCCKLCADFLNVIFTAFAIWKHLRSL